MHYREFIEKSIRLMRRCYQATLFGWSSSPTRNREHRGNSALNCHHQKKKIRKIMSASVTVSWSWHLLNAVEISKNINRSLRSTTLSTRYHLLSYQLLAFIRSVRRPLTSTKRTDYRLSIEMFGWEEEEEPNDSRNKKFSRNKTILLCVFNRSVNRPQRRMVICGGDWRRTLCVYVVQCECALRHHWHSAQCTCASGSTRRSACHPIDGDKPNDDHVSVLKMMISVTRMMWLIF